jgi:hypothetical protein
LFIKLSNSGQELLQAHLQNREYDYPYGEFIGKGDNLIQNPNYVTVNNTGRYYINKKQYFDNIPLNVYEFSIGGYQVIKHYIQGGKSKRTELSFDEIENVTATVKSITFTIEKMEEIEILTKDWVM